MNDQESAQTASPDRHLDEKSRPRRLFRRLLVILLFAVAMLLLIVGYRWRRQLAFIESVEAGYGSVGTERWYGTVDTERWGPAWLRDLVGAERMRGLERMTNIRIVKADDDDLRMLYRQQLPDRLELVDPRFSAEAAGQFHRLNGIKALEFWSLKEHKAEILTQLKSFHSLKNLVVANSELTDDDLKLLAEITTLQDLDFQRSTFQGADLSRLRKLTNLRELDLAETGLTDEEAAAIEELIQIDHLNLTGNPITDRGLEHLESLTNLRWLTLVGTKITDRGLRSLAKMTDLENVDLYDTGITDAGLPHLLRLFKLRRLNLTGTAVTPEGYEQAKVTLPSCDVSHSVLLQRTVAK